MHPPDYLHFLILTAERDIVSVSLREGLDFLDELDADFGDDWYILETAGRDQPDVPRTFTAGVDQ